MKFLSIVLVLAFACIAHGEEKYAEPVVEAPWLKLRKAPVFESAPLVLAKVWGPTIPVGTEFAIEQSYGRWVFGKPAPLTNMKAKDYAPEGWVYNRMLVPPQDSSTRSRSQQKAAFQAEYHFSEAAGNLGLDLGKGASLYLQFLNNLVLSENTMAAFAKMDEGDTAAQSIHFDFIESANAAAEGDKSPKMNLGFTGANLNFLREEVKKVRKKRAKVQKAIEDNTLKAPSIPDAVAFDRELALGRYIAAKSIDLPELSHEEVDGSLYLRAITLRTLRGCPEEIQKAWAETPWQVSRMKTLFGRPSGENLFLQLELPGSQFFYSDQVIRLAENEAELAFALIRPFIMSTRYGKLAWKFSEDWEKDIPKLAASAISDLRQQQSSKLNKKLDIADEIYTDITASVCLANAGYLHNAGLNFLKKIRSARKEDWASWVIEHSIGLDYRLEQLQDRLEKGLGDGSVKRSMITNPKRFHAAQKLWVI